jgi:hypothetical protein
MDPKGLQAGPLHRGVPDPPEEVLGGSGRGYGDPRYGQLLADLVAAERLARNSDSGYWIASLDPKAAHHSLTGSLAIGPQPGKVRAVGLLSDGLARAVTHLDIHKTWADLLHDLVENGSESCISSVRRVEQSDPEGQRFPRTIRSDDASAITLELL